MFLMAADWPDELSFSLILLQRARIYNVMKLSSNIIYGTPLPPLFSIHENEINFFCSN